MTKPIANDLHDPSIKDRAGDAYEAARERFSSATDKAADTLSSVTEKAADKLSAVTEKAADRLSAVSEKTASGIEANPVVALIAGIAIGAVVGALLPRTERETAVLGGIGARLGDAAKAALLAAREAGEAKIDEVGLNADAARDQAKKLFTHVGEVATAAGQAAVGAAREKA